MLGIYGIIMAVLLNGRIAKNDLTDAESYRYLWTGLTNGLSNLAAGYAIGQIGYNAIFDNRDQIDTFLNLVFGEALGLYGLIVGIIMMSSE